MSPEVMAIALLAGLAVTSLLLGLRRLAEGQRSAWARRYLDGERPDDPRGRGRPGWLDSLRQEAERAGLQVSALHLLLMPVICGAAAAGVAFAVLGHALVAALAALTGLWAPPAWIRYMAAGRSMLFSRQLVTALDIMSAAIRSGASEAQALAMVAREMPAPVGPEMQRVVDEHRVGLPLGLALEHACERLGSEDLRVLATAVALRQEANVSVNLAAVFDQVGQTIRERHSFREHVRALTVENRIAGVGIIGLTVVVLGIIRAAAPEYLSSLFNTGWGTGLVVAAVAVMGLSMWLLVRMADVSGE